MRPGPLPGRLELQMPHPEVVPHEDHRLLDRHPVGAVLDVLDVAGGRATLQKIADALHRKRVRDIRRRDLPWLEAAGILTVEGDTVTRAGAWLDRLQEVREAGGKLEAEELARKHYRDRSRAYHSRHETPKSEPSAAGVAAVGRSHKKRAEQIAAHGEHQARVRAAEREHMRFAKRFVRDRLLWRRPPGTPRTPSGPTRSTTPSRLTPKRRTSASPESREVAVSRPARGPPGV